MSEANGSGTHGHVLFVWTAAGYELEEREGDPPAPGSELERHGTTLVVTRIGPSPLPLDARPCAFTGGP
jgi:hypothetical protein